jgi:Family of unknown function (DUF5989)
VTCADNSKILGQYRCDKPRMTTPLIHDLQDLGLSVEVKAAARSPVSYKELLMANSLARELWTYLKIRKKVWLVAIIAIMALLGAVMIFAQGSALAPLIYTIF